MNERKSATVEEVNNRHREKMQKRKAAQDKKLSNKQQTKGLLIVHTGTGKGKSTAAFGMVLRAIHHQMQTGIVQFIKGPWESGERNVLANFPEFVQIFAMGEGFTWETQDRERDVRAAMRAWQQAKAFIEDEKIKLVVLDELNIALRYDYLPLHEVLSVLNNRPKDTHIVVTGRNAKEELIEIADMVTEMTLIKHPFKQGIKAQAGIEF